jgi:hypothetical protein
MLVPIQGRTTRGGLVPRRQGGVIDMAGSQTAKPISVIGADHFDGNFAGNNYHDCRSRRRSALAQEPSGGLDQPMPASF